MTATGRLRGGIPDASPAPPSAGLGQALTGARVHIPVTIPRTNIKGSMRLVSHAEATTITAEARAYFKELGIPVDAAGLGALGVAERWNGEVAVRYLSHAIRNPLNEAEALDILEEWRELDDDQIAALYKSYQDLASRIDPLGDGAAPLTDAEHDQIVLASKKKDVDYLMSYGSHRLALYAITTVAQPAS